jgi:hypothetical protein
MSFTADEYEQLKANQKRASSMNSRPPMITLSAALTKKIGNRKAKAVKREKKKYGIYTNKTEAAYADHLEVLKKDGKIQRWWYQPWSSNLCPGVRYTPDFMRLENDDTVTFIDTKAQWGKGEDAHVHAERDAVMRNKFAVEIFPHWRWMFSWKDKRTGEWDTREFIPGDCKS